MGSRYNHLPCYKYVNVEAVSPVLEKSAGKPLRDYKVYGNSWQKEPPTPDNPQKIATLENFDESTGKYKIPITVKGKNLWSFGDLEFTRYQKVTFSSPLPAGTYTFKAEVMCTDTDSQSRLVIIRDINGNQIAYVYFKDLKENAFSFTVNEKISYMELYAGKNYADAVDDICTYTNVQLERGSTATEYEPYVDPTTHHIFLDEPLRKLGDYADYIDFKNQKIVRNICSLILDGSETWGRQSINSYGIANFHTLPPRFKNNMQLLSDKFTKQTTLIANTSTEGAMLVLGNNVPYLYIRLNSSRASTIAEFKEWLTENNVNVMYVLETPIEQPIELPAFETNKYTNIFEIGTTLQPSNVIAQYYKKG